MPTKPEYSSNVLQLASDAAFAALGDAYDATVTKVTPALAVLKQGLHRPARQVGAQFRNWVDREVASVLSALADHVVEVQDVDVPAEATARAAADAVLHEEVDLLPALNFSEAVTFGGGNANAAAYDTAGRRWLVVGASANVRGSRRCGWAWDASSLVSGVSAGTENVTSIDVDASGNWVAAATSCVFTYNASTNVYAKVATTASLGGVKYSPTAARWCRLVADGLSAAVETSTDRATWTAGTVPTEWGDFSTYPNFGSDVALGVNKTSGRLVAAGYGAAGIGPSGDGSFRVMTSDDGGQTWTDRGTHAHTIVAASSNSIAHNPESGEWLYTVGESSMPSSCEVWRSTDDGATWTKVATLADNNVISPAPIRSGTWVAVSRRLVIGSDHPVVVFSTDSGTTWRFADFDMEAGSNVRGAFSGGGGAVLLSTTQAWPSARYRGGGSVLT